MTDSDLDLLPCPFCGGSARIVEGEESAYVQCEKVKMHRAIWFDGDNNAADEVREQWNRRTATAPAGDLVERLEQAAQRCRKAMEEGTNDPFQLATMAYFRLSEAATALRTQPSDRGEVAGYLFRLRYGPDRWSHQLMFSAVLPKEGDYKELQTLYAFPPAGEGVTVTPEELLLLMRLRDNQGSGVHDVVEHDPEKWALGFALSDRGLLAMVDHPKGATFHITRLGLNTILVALSKGVGNG